MSIRDVRIREKKLSYTLIAPLFILLAVLVLLPEIWALVLSFTDYRLGAKMSFIGLENFRIIFSDERFWKAIYNNAIFITCSVILQMVIGMAISLLLARGFKFQRLWMSLILAPMAISPAVAAVTWKYLLNFNIGPINYITGLIGLGRHMWLSNPALAFPSVILVYVWVSTPNVILMLYPVRLTISETLYEAARIDGANAFQTFRSITFPLMKPVFYTAVVFRIMLAFRSFGEIWTLTEGGPVGATEVAAIYLFRTGFRYWRFGTAAAVAWVILVLTLVTASPQIKRMYSSMFGGEQ